MTPPTEMPTAAPPLLREHPSFVMFWCARTATAAAYMMQAVAIGWQIYEMTGSAFDLGLVGLVQFVPFVLLTLVIGQTADRYDRRVVARTCQIVKAGAALTLAFGSYYGWLNRDSILLILLVTGTARAFETPTLLTMVPGLVPPILLPRAIAASASANQTAIICGPALGGLIYSFGPTVVYVVCAGTFITASILVSLVKLRQVQDRKRVTLETMLAGFAYIRSRPIILGAISLDLFALLLGSVTALLPVYARDILMTGPWGLGLLRSAPAVGALTVSIVLAHAALDRKVGTMLFTTMGIFAMSIIVFSLSTTLALSIAALIVYGATDAISVVIRHSLVQLRTPDDMQGRVMAINSMFTGTSGTLGEFRAGAVAAAFGAVSSVFIGGIGALLVALLWMKLFPDLVRAKSLQHKSET